MVVLMADCSTWQSKIMLFNFDDKGMELPVHTLHTTSIQKRGQVDIYVSPKGLSIVAPSVKTKGQCTHFFLPQTGKLV